MTWRKWLGKMHLSTDVCHRTLLRDGRVRVTYRKEDTLRLPNLDAEHRAVRQGPKPAPSKRELKPALSIFLESAAAATSTKHIKTAHVVRMDVSPCTHTDTQEHELKDSHTPSQGPPVEENEGD